MSGEVHGPVDALAALPNLVIAGVTKAGTTSLFAYLGQHPDVCAASRKDINHFSSLRHGEPAPPISSYSSYFGHCSGQRIRLDASPDYFNGGWAVVGALHRDLPDLRVVFTLRDPASRLWSHYRYRRQLGVAGEQVSFDDFVNACLSARAGQDSGATRDYRTLSMGFYAQHLEPWFAVFGEAARILFFEDLAADPRTVVADLCGWLGIGVAAAERIEYAAHNRTVEPRSRALQGLADRINAAGDRVFRHYPGLEARLREAYHAVNARRHTEGPSPQDRALAESVYAEANRELAAMLETRGYALPGWLTRARA